MSLVIDGICPILGRSGGVSASDIGPSDLNETGLDALGPGALGPNELQLLLEKYWPNFFFQVPIYSFPEWAIADRNYLFLF